MSISEIDVGVVVRDRRRPGRRTDVSAALLPLLRREERALLPPLADDDEAPLALRGLRDGQGIVLGLGLGVIMWAALIGAGAAFYQAF